MPKLEWDKVGERLFETGVDQGVLFKFDASQNAYGEGEAWNGLTSVEESPSGAEPNKFYADNTVYANIMSTEEFGMTINAYTFPAGFKSCNGSKEMVKGVTIGQQTRDTFGFTYRTLIGSDTEGTDKGYKIHLVYGCQASPSSKTNSTVNESPEPGEMSWSVTTTPIKVNGFKPTAHLEINSTDFVTEAEQAKLKAFEDVLYGSDASGTSTGSTSRLPLPLEVAQLLGTTTAQG